MQALYQMEVVNQPMHKILTFPWLNEPLPAALRNYTEELIQGVADRWDALDDAIQAFSRKDITQISTVNRCILRIGIYEIMRGDLPTGVIIDDLVDLARRYEGEESAAFVNGILDSLQKENQTDSGETDGVPDRGS